MIAELTTKPTEYRYPLLKLVITYLLAPLLSIVSLGSGAFLLKSDGVLAGSLMILFGVFFMLVGAYGSLMCSSMVVADKGIAARNFGRILKLIRWEDVTKVTKIRRWNPGAGRFQDSFFVLDGTYTPLRERMMNLRGPITFDDGIRGLRALLDQINEAARRHHFPLVVLDQEAAGKLAAQTGAPAWRRIVPKVEEVKVTAF